MHMRELPMSHVLAYFSVRLDSTLCIPAVTHSPLRLVYIGTNVRAFWRKVKMPHGSSASKL